MIDERTKGMVKTCNWLFWISLAMFFTMRISVLILFNMTAEETGADIEAVQTTYEANPIFKSLMQLRGMNYLLQFIIVPAIAFSTFFIYRRKVLEQKASVDVLQYFIMFTFFLILNNFINDVASLVGRLM